MCARSACRHVCSIEVPNHQVQQMSSCWWGWLSPSMIIRSRQGALECRCLQAEWACPRVCVHGGCLCVCVWTWVLPRMKSDIHAVHLTGQGDSCTFFYLSLHGQYSHETDAHVETTLASRALRPYGKRQFGGNCFLEPFIGVSLCSVAVKHTVKTNKQKTT